MKTTAIERKNWKEAGRTRNFERYLSDLENLLDENRKVIEETRKFLKKIKGENQ